MPHLWHQCLIWNYQMIHTLKNIIYVSKEDDFWGNGENNTGKNYLGKLLVKIRNEYFEENISS